MNFDKLSEIISKDNKWKEPIEKNEAQINPPIANPNVIQKNDQMKGNVNIQKLSQYLPSQDPMKLKIAMGAVMSGRRLNNLQLIQLGNAFIDLLKANPQETIQVMNLLKRVSMEAGENQNEEV